MATSTPFHYDAAHDGPSFLQLLPQDVRNLVLKYYEQMPEEPQQVPHLRHLVRLSYDQLQSLARIHGHKRVFDVFNQ